MGEPINHTFLDGIFPQKNIHFGGTPIYGNPHMVVSNLRGPSDPQVFLPSQMILRSQSTHVHTFSRCATGMSLPHFAVFSSFFFENQEDAMFTLSTTTYRRFTDHRGFINILVGGLNPSEKY